MPVKIDDVVMEFKTTNNLYGKVYGVIIKLSSISNLTICIGSAVGVWYERMDIREDEDEYYKDYSFYWHMSIFPYISMSSFKGNYEYFKVINPMARILYKFKRDRFEIAVGKLLIEQELCQLK